MTDKAPSKVVRIDYYPNEYIVGMSSIPYSHQAIYWMVCSLVMSHGGAIDNDPKRIGGLCGIGSAKARNMISDLVSWGKLTENESKITQKRAENEWKNAKKRTVSAQNNGQNGGRPPKENNDLTKPGGSEQQQQQQQHKNHPCSPHGEFNIDQAFKDCQSILDDCGYDRLRFEVSAGNYEPMLNLLRNGVPVHALKAAAGSVPPERARTVGSPPAWIAKLFNSNREKFMAIPPPDPGLAAYGEAVTKWQDGGKVGPMPRIEDFIQARKAANDG